VKSGEFLSSPQARLRKGWNYPMSERAKIVRLGLQTVFGRLFGKKTQILFLSSPFPQLSTLFDAR
jgi:hypothetical protein